MSSTENKSGTAIFAVVFVGTILFFLLVLFKFNKGPIDKIMFEPGPTFTEQERTERDRMWRTSSEEAIALGKKLYNINVFGDFEETMQKVIGGVYGSTEVELYRVLTHGVPGTPLRPLDHLPQDTRWKMVHYMRSEMADPKSASDDDWNSLDREGI